MMAMLGRELIALLGTDCAAEPESTVCASGMQRCYRWRRGSGWLFVKTVPATSNDRLAAEAAGLEALATAGALRVPRVCAQGIAAAEAFLALEWIDMAAATADSERRLGEGLAALHCVTADRFGWNHDNHIGPTPQANGWLADWAAFWREQRLQPQLDLAIRRGHGHLLADSGARLLEVLEVLLVDHGPLPSLLHGDLWGGNWCTTTDGQPVIFDPAVYYGDRETDLAMTRLFGGFGRRFYEAYQGSAPLPAGHAVRAELYNVYHVLNHANLFGGGYVRQAHRMIRRLLAQAHA
jgi:fructosamine-3-kinase